MAEFLPVGAIGSNDDKVAAAQRKKLLNLEKTGGNGGACFVATLDDFTKSGTFPNWNAGNVPMVNT